MDRLPQRLTAFFYLCKYILFLLHFIQVYIRSLLQKVYIQPYSFMSFFFSSLKHENKTTLSLGLVAKPFGGLYHRFGRGLVYSFDLLEYSRADWTGLVSSVWVFFFFFFVCVSQHCWCSVFWF